MGLPQRKPLVAPMLLKTKPYALVNTRRVTLKEPWDRKSGKRSTLTALPDLKTTFVEATAAEGETAEEEAEVTQVAASSALTPNRISTSPCWIRLIQHQTRKTGQHTCQQVAPLQEALKPDTRKQYFLQNGGLILLTLTVPILYSIKAHPLNQREDTQTTTSQAYCTSRGQPNTSKPLSLATCGTTCRLN